MASRLSFNFQESFSELDGHEFDDDEASSEAESYDSVAEAAFEDGLDPLLDIEDNDYTPSSCDTAAGSETPPPCDTSVRSETPPSADPLPSRSQPAAQPETRSPTPTPKKRKAPAASSAAVSQERWRSITEPDKAPSQFPFCPARIPGPQLDKTRHYNPLELFQLFFSKSVMQSLCANTNKNGKRRQTQGKGTEWTPLCVEEMYRYLSLVVYMGLVKVGSVCNYWSGHRLYKLPFPASVMTRKRFEAITYTLHMSDPAADAREEANRGSEGYDRLHWLRPLMDDIISACRAFYHPHQALAIDERMVASKNRVGLKQYMKNKPTKWGFKLFVLADSRNGYTCNFNVYQGKLFTATGKGLSYDVVVDLLNVAHLGTGYHVYVDNFYTSIELFQHLHQMRYGACGTVRENRRGFPTVTNNSLQKDAERGSIRWLRDGPFLHTKWMDTRLVTMCSTIHKAYSGDMVPRRIRNHDGTWTKQQVPIPAPVKAYNKFMGGVDLSDALLKYYSVARKTQRWYKKLFYHFVDIAVVNSFLLHKEMALVKGTKPMTQKQFREDLSVLLADCWTADVPEEVEASASEDEDSPQEEEEEVECCPVTIVDTSLTVPYLRATEGRKYCVLCAKEKRRNKTIWKCESCTVPLCLTADRNCYKMWHEFCK